MILISAGAITFATLRVVRHFPELFFCCFPNVNLFLHLGEHFVQAGSFQFFAELV